MARLHPRLRTLLRPPSTPMIWPVTQSFCGSRRKAPTAAITSGFPRRPRAWRASEAFRPASVPRRSRARGGPRVLVPRRSPGVLGSRRWRKPPGPGLAPRPWPRPAPRGTEAPDGPRRWRTGARCLPSGGVGPPAAPWRTQCAGSVGALSRSQRQRSGEPVSAGWSRRSLPVPGGEDRLRRPAGSAPTPGRPGRGRFRRFRPPPGR